MKKTSVTQIVIAFIAVGLIGSLAGIAYADDPKDLKGQKCQLLGTTSAGGCSGSPVLNTPPLDPGWHCPGTKTNTEHDGCTQCASGKEEETCSLLDNTTNASICKKRTQIIPCVIFEGACIEAPGGGWTNWDDTHEKACSL
jgi:hypothetical protein